MQKLKTNKGNIILEGIISLFIISLLIFCAADIYTASNKLNSENKAKGSYIDILDAVSKEIIYNKDYHFIESLDVSRELYIPCDSLNISVIENNDLNNLFVSAVPDKLPYLYINIENGDIYKIRLSIYYKKYNGSGEIHSDLYKGKY